MKRKLLSFLLALCMILGMAPLTLAASADGGEEAAQTDYYVQYGGTGDGKTADTPAGTIKTVMATIKADGHDANSYVTVNVMNADGAAAPKKDVAVTADNFKYVTLMEDPVAHDFAVIFTTYDYKSSEDNKTAIALASYGGAYKNYSAQGPETFHNIALIDVRTDWHSDFYANGQAVMIQNVDFLRVNGSSKLIDWTPTVQVLERGNIGTTNTGSFGQLIVDDSFGDVTYGLAGWYNANSGRDVNHNIELNISTPQTISNVYLANSNESSSYFNFKKNVYLSLGEGVTVKNFGEKSGVKSTVAGKITVILKGSAEIENYNLSLTLPLCIINDKLIYGIAHANDDGGIFVTGDPDATVYAYNGGKKIYVSERGTKWNTTAEFLNLPVGEWTLTTDLSAAKAATDENGTWTWSDVVDGVITGTAPVAEQSGVYYVMYKGEGNGKLPSTPFGSLADAVTAIEADNTVDEGTIYVVSNPEYDTLEKQIPVDQKNVNYLAWGLNSKTWTKPITFIGYEENSVSTITHLETPGVGDFILGGPSKFTNITLFLTRPNDEGFATSGQKIEIDDTVIFKSLDYDPYWHPQENGWQIKNSATKTPNDGFFRFGSGRGNATGEGDRITLNLKRAFSVYHDWKAETYDNDVTLAVDTNGNAFSFIKWGTAAVTYKKNLNLVFGNVSTLSQSQDSNNVTVSGALQVVHPKSLSYAVPTNFKVGDNKTWEMVTDTYGMLDVTSTAGAFKVVGDKTLYAYNGDMVIYYSVNGTLTVPAGKWSVTTDLAAAKKAIGDVQSWADDENGKITGTLDAPVVAGTYFAMYGGGGLGKTPGTASSSIASLIAKIEADDSVTEGTIYVINNPDYAGKYITSGEELHYLVWDANSASHTKKITFKGAKKDSTQASGYSIDKDAVIIGFNKIMNADIALAGPSAFDNITIVRPRGNDAGFATMGHEASFTDTVSFKQVVGGYGTYNYSSYSDASTSENGRSGGYGNMFKLGSGFNASTGKGGRVTLRHNGAFTISTDWKDTTYDNDVVLDVDLQGGALKLHWTTDAATVTYKKNVSLVLGNVSSIDQSIHGNHGSVTVKGDFNIIHKAVENFDATLPATVTVEGDTYELITSEAGIVDVTAKSGVFKSLLSDESKALLAKRVVADGETAYYVVSDPDENTLTLEPGKWEISTIDADKRVQLDFNGEYYAYGYKGNAFKLPDHADTAFQKFEYWIYDGNGYPTGTLFTVPTDSSDIEFAIGWTKIENQTSIFVNNASGEDSNLGSKDEPVKTLEKAFELVNASDDETKNIVIVGTYAYSGQLPANSSLVTICGDGSGNSVFDLNNDYILLGGDIKFENIKLSKTTTEDGKNLAASGHKLIIGKGVVNDTDKPLTLRLGLFNEDSPKQVAEFYSGNFGSMDLSVYYVPTNQTKSMAGADILVDGATIGSISLSADGYDGAQGTNKFTGDVRFTVNSGSLGSVTVGQRQADYADDLTFEFLANNGIETTVNVGTKFAHNYIVFAEKLDGCSLEYTDTKGKYKVNGTKTAVAVQNGAQIAVSHKGYITIPEGTTTVKFVDKIEYIYDKENGRITFYDLEGQFDLSTVTPYVPSGKAFLGWKKSDNIIADKIASYDFEDYVEAVYVDLITDVKESNANFYIKGAQIRLASGSGETEIKQGLRYVVDLKDSLKEALCGNGDDVKFGTLVLPTDLTRGHDMKIDPDTEKSLAMYNEYALALPEKASTTGWTSGTWSSINDGPAVVKGEKIFGYENDGTQYTVCLTGIEKENYETYYSVKGYVIYTDYQGIKRVAYTDYYQTNIYEVAKAAVADGKSDTALTTVIDYYENKRLAAYEEKYTKTSHKTDTANHDKGKINSWANTEGAATIAGITNTDFYSYSNGLIVREVEYNLFNGAREPVTIIQAGDTHLNYVNDRDWEEQSTCILATYKGREWNRNGGSVPHINTFMQFGSMFDQMVITGDVLDYFSWGCGEMVQKLIVDRADGILMAIGNHEPAIHMQNVSHTCNTASDLATVHSRLSEFWPNDTKYASKILKNDNGEEMVMLVVIDNQAHYFQWEEIATGLTKDIATAKEKGLKILIFSHCPISTRGGSESDMCQVFYQAGDLSGFTQKDDNGYAVIELGTKESGSTSNELDKRVYKLITDNADIIRGVFCGDYHNFMYNEIKGTDENTTMIPQYVSSANAYGARVTKITIK